MWPEEAAERVEGMFQDIVKRADHWDEIKNNVRNGNITGSGKGYTLLHAFVREGNADATKYLLDNAMEVNAKTNITHETALHSAIQLQQVEMCILLLRYGADVFSKDNAGITPWELGISSDKMEILEILAEHTTTAGILFSVQAGRKSPFAIAIEKERNAAALKLIERGVKIGAEKATWNELLLLAAEKGDSVIQIVKRLLKMGANVDYKNATGRTPLMAASEKGALRVVRTLLEKSPDLEAADVSGYTALSLASQEGYEGIVKRLLDAGAKVDGYPRERAPHLIASNPAVLALLRKKQPWKKTWFRQSLDPLSYAVMKG